jgi:hypothetical protein
MPPPERDPHANLASGRPCSSCGHQRLAKRNASMAVLSIGIWAPDSELSRLTASQPRLVRACDDAIAAQYECCCDVAQRVLQRLVLPKPQNGPAGRIRSEHLWRGWLWRSCLQVCLRSLISVSIETRVLRQLLRRRDVDIPLPQCDYGVRLTTRICEIWTRLSYRC